MLLLPKYRFIREPSDRYLNRFFFGIPLSKNLSSPHLGQCVWAATFK